MEDMAILMLGITLGAITTSNLKKSHPGKDSFTIEEISEASFAATQQLIAELKQTKEDQALRNVTLPDDITIN